LAVLARSLEGEGYIAPDSSRYLALADSLAQNGTFRISDWEGVSRPEYLTLPAYPLLLAALKSLGIQSLVPVLVAQCLLGSIVAAMVFALADRIGGRRSGLVAGAVASLDVQSVAYSNVVLTDALSGGAVFLAFAAFLYYFGRRTTGAALLGGVAAAAAAFLRPANFVILGIGAVAVIAANAAKGKRDQRRMLLHAIVLLLVGLLPVLGWSLRNYALSGSWFYSTSGDVVLVRWQLPRLVSATEDIPLDQAREVVTSRLGIEAEYLTLGARPPFYRDRARDLAWEIAREHPATFLRIFGGGLARVAAQPDAFICQLLGQPVAEQGLAAGNIGVAGAFQQRWEELGWGLRLLYFGQLPYLVCLWLCAAAAAAGLWKPDLRGPILILLLGVVAFVLISGGYPGDPRYRLPAIPLIILLASLAPSAWSRLNSKAR
jgi:4-amino-4-deoxy-L-arabinose transferase-like glycosyltransferase